MREGWKQYALGDICTIVKGTSPTLKTAPGPYPLIVTAARPSSSSEYQFDGEAVCIPMVSSTGHGHASLKRVHYASGKFAVANIIAAVQAKDATVVSTKFLSLYLQHFKDELIVTRMRGTANVSLSIAGLATIPVELPPLDEQQRIVDLIGSADAAIEAAEVSAAASELAYSNVRQDLMSGNTRLGGYTEPLDVARLDDLAEVIMGQSPPGSSYNRSGNGIPFIQGSAEFGESNPTPIQWCSDPRKIAEPGDLLVSVRAPVGDMNVAADRVAIGRGLSILRSHEGVVQGYLALAVENSASQLASVSAGSTFASITKSSLCGIEVACHSEEEQKLIVKTLTPLKSTGRATEELAASFRAARSELLTVLLSGEHEIPESYDLETAAQLDLAA